MYRSGVPLCFPNGVSSYIHGVSGVPWGWVKFMCDGVSYHVGSYIRCDSASFRPPPPGSAQSWFGSSGSGTGRSGRQAADRPAQPRHADAEAPGPTGSEVQGRTSIFGARTRNLGYCIQEFHGSGSLYRGPLNGGHGPLDWVFRPLAPQAIPKLRPESAPLRRFARNVHPMVRSVDVLSLYTQLRQL